MIPTSPLLLLAESIARNAHADQFRRDGVTPYIVHPQAVASMCNTEAEKAVAWLHDVVEDTDVNLFDLYIQGVPREIITAVDAMTKKNDQSYDSYLAVVKANPLAKAVKINDIVTNLNDAPTEKQIAKYAKALQYLLS